MEGLEVRAGTWGLLGTGVQQLARGVGQQVGRAALLLCVSPVLIVLQINSCWSMSLRSTIQCRDKDVVRLENRPQLFMMLVTY